MRSLQSRLFPKREKATTGVLPARMAARNRRSWQVRGGLLPYVFMSPAILLLLFVYAVPVIFIIALSLTDWTGMGFQFHFMGLQNFVRILTGGERTWSAIRNTLLFAGGTVIFQNLAALVVALLLDKDFRGRDFCRMLFFMPTVIASVAVANIWSMMLNPRSGPVPIIAAQLGLDWLAKIQWMANPDIVMFTMILVNIWQWYGYDMVIFLAGLQAIPTHLYEAAEVDGATSWDRLRYITLPLLKPAFTVAIILTTIGGLKVFDLPYVMTGGGPGRASQTIVMEIVQRTFLNNDLGYAGALSLLLLVSITIILIIQSRLLRSTGSEESK